MIDGIAMAGYGNPIAWGRRQANCLILNRIEEDLLRSDYC